MDKVYKATWEISLKAQLDRADSRLYWTYSEPNTWIVRSGALQQLASEFAGKLLDLPELAIPIDKEQKVFQMLTLKNDDFLKFLKGDIAEYNPDAVQATVCNYLVGSHVLTPMRTLATLVGTHITVQMRDLPDGYPCWFYYNQWRSTDDREDSSDNAGDVEKSDFSIARSYAASNIGQFILPFPELFVTIANDGSISWLDGLSVSETLAKLLSIRVLHKQTVLKFLHDKPNNKCEIRFSDQLQLSAYPKGRVCLCIPIPGKNPSKTRKASEEPISVRSPEVVIVSSPVQRCLKQMSDIWQDKFARSVLITGPPGAGKEIYSVSAAYGNGRAAKAFNSLSLAVGSTADQERMLFGTESEAGHVKKSEGGALFIDEVHYPPTEPGVRSSLLRALESKEYNPIGSQKLSKFSDIMWIFASSLPLSGKNSLSSLDPPDFWTRMTHVIEVAHPLSPRHTDRLERLLMLRCLFKFFWWDRVETYFDYDPTRTFFGEPEGDEEELLLSDIIKEKRVAAFIDEASLELMAAVFCTAIHKSFTRFGGCELDKLSIRGIRSIVSRLFSIQVEEVVATKGKINMTKFKKVLPGIIGEIRQIATLTH